MRTEILRLVDEEPGIHLQELKRRLEAGSGQLAHHLRVLRERELVVEYGAEGYRCYFLPGRLDDETREALVRLRSDGARTVLREVVEGDPRSLRGLADANGLSPSTVKYHVDRLEETGVLTCGGGGGGADLQLTELGDRVARTVAGG